MSSTRAPRARRFPALLRREVFARDLGVCAACGLDTEALRRELQSLTPEARKLREAELSWPSHRMDFWDADHVLPFAQGGRCDLGNMQTLCLPCHVKKSGKQMRRPPKRQPRPLDQELGSGTLRPGYWVALTLAEDAAPLPSYVGQIQEVDARGVRLTLIDWLIGRATGWDLFVPWRQILSALVATPDHDTEAFGKDAGRWQAAVSRKTETS